QMIIMEQFRDLPIVQFTARYHKPINRLGNAAQMVPFRSLHKRTGKLLMDEETLPQSSQHFYALNADPRSGRIEVLSSNLKIVHEAAQPKGLGAPTAAANSPSRSAAAAELDAQRAQQLELEARRFRVEQRARQIQIQQQLERQKK